MSKLTAAQLIALASAQGIHLREVGAPDPQLAGIGNNALQRELDSVRHAMTGSHVIAGRVGSPLAEAVYALRLKLDERNSGTVQKQLDESLAYGRAIAASLKATVALLDEARAAKPAGAVNIAAMHAEIGRLQGELAEARNDLRAKAKSAAPEARAVVVEAPAIPPEIVSAFRITFHGAQGIGTADRIKAVGGRWRRTSPNGAAKMAGFWELPASEAARQLCAQLRAEDKPIEVSAV